MKSVRRAFLATMLVLFGNIATSAQAESAGNHVAEFQAGLLSTMKVAETIDVQARYTMLEPTIINTFHLSLMAGLSAGQHWQTATKNQRERLVDGFSRMSVATLATLFDGYSGQSFSVTGEVVVPKALLLLIQLSKAQAKIAISSSLMLRANLAPNGASLT